MIAWRNMQIANLFIYLFDLDMAKSLSDFYITHKQKIEKHKKKKYITEYNLKIKEQ